MATTASGIEAARELDELYRSHAAEIFRYAYAVLGNRADAEDITQTTFVNALRALERGEQPRAPKNWLITIAHNLIRQRFRQQQSRPRLVELDHDLPAAEAEDDDGPAIDDLVRALQRIPPAQRQALILRELEGRSYAEIGELLDVSQSALETLIFRARRSLADELENQVTCDGAELALSRAADGRLSRKQRRRLLGHLDECPSCARTAARSLKYRRAFRALAVLPLPFSLTLFKGAPSASAAAGLPTIGAGAAASTAAGVGATGIGVKIAAGLAAVAVAGGAGYEGVKAVQAPPAQERPAAASVSTPRAQIPAARVAMPAAAAASTPAAVATKAPVLRNSQPAATKPKPTQAKAPTRGRSTTAPGHTKLKPEPARTTAPGQARKAEVAPAQTPRTRVKPKAAPEPTPKVKAKAKAKPRPLPAPNAKASPQAASERGKSAAAPGQAKRAEEAQQPEPKRRAAAGLKQRAPDATSADAAP